jgi:outer membrane protein assembly factor BamB
MTRYLTLAFFMVYLLTGTVLLAADWPAFRGSFGDGISIEKLGNKDWKAKAPTLLWKVALTDGGYAGPAVAGGKVFIIDHSGKNDVVRALDLQTGAEQWQYAYADTAVANNGFARSTPVIDGRRVYTLSRLGIIHCLDAQTGSLIWMRDIIAAFAGHRPEWDLSASPLIDQEKLILCPGGANAAVVALDKNTGATIWKGGGSEEPGYATPVQATINNRPAYIIFTAKSLLAVDAKTGATLWNYPWKTSCGVNAATPIVFGNFVYITSAYGFGSELLDISQHAPRLIWHQKEIESRFSTPIYADGYLYSTTITNHLICVNARTGVIEWRQTGFELGGMVAIDGMLIVGDGKTGAFALMKLTPSGYQEYGNITPLGGQSWTAPIIADGMLIVRNPKTIACLDLN